MAATIGIVDAGGFYTSDDVEGALQEIGAGATGFRQNGWYQAGVADFDTAVTDAGLTITLAGTWVALLGAGSVDVSGDFIALPNNTTRWVYIDPAGVLTASAGVPNITTTENVIVGFFTTAGGAVTGKVDGRFFVRNDNRKIDYSVRASGAAADANSEACFFSLDAALLWVDTFNTSGVSRKTHITIRGEHILSSTVTFGTDNVVLHGEDGAEFVSGATVAPMFDLNGQSGIEFHNITFTCAHAASTAIQDTSASLADLRVEKCVFSGTWVTAINLDGTVTDRAVISDTVAVASLSGIYIAQPQSCAIVRTQVTGSGGGVASGISLGDPALTPTSINSVVDQCRIEAFDIGVSLRTLGSKVTSTLFVDCGHGAVFVDYGSLGISITDNNFVGSNVTQTGIAIRGSASAGENTRQITVTNNKMLDLTDLGIKILGYVTDSVISGNTIDCYAGNATNPTANGIVIEENGAENVPTDIVVTNNSIRRCKKGVIVAGAADIRASGTFTVVNNANVTNGDTIQIEGVTLTAVPGVPAANQFQIGGNANATALNIKNAINNTAAIYNNLAHATVLANVVTVYAVEAGPWGNTLNLVSSDPTGITRSGAALTGGEYHNIRNITITDNVIHHCAVGQAGIPGPQTVEGLGGAGVVLYFAQNCTVSGNNIHDIGILLTGGEVPFFPPGADVYSNGVVVWNSITVNCHGNNIYNVTPHGGGDAQGVTIAIQNTSVEPSFTFISEDLHFEGNVIEWQQSGDVRTLGASPGALAIATGIDNTYEDPDAALELRGLFFDSNTLRNPFLAGISGFFLGGRCSDVSIRGNKISPIQGGGVIFISTNDDLKGFTITDNVMLQEYAYLGGPAPYMAFGGVHMETASGGAVSNIEDITIANNIILAVTSAITFVATGEGANLSITGNTIRMAGAGTAPSYARAIRMNLGTDGTKGTSINDITITGNVLEGGDGVRINSAFGVLVENITVTGNSFNGTDNDTDPTPAFPDGFYAAFSLNVEEPVGPGLPIGDILRNVVISGNTFSNTQREAIAVTKGDTVAVRYVHGVNITNNTLDLCALGSLTTPDVSTAILVNVLSTTSLDIVSDINVVGNTFTNTKVYNDADAGLNVAALVGISSTTAVLGGLRVSGNNFTQCETVTNNAATCVSGSIVVFSFFGLTTLDFSDNKFVSPLSHATSSGSAAIAGVLAVYCPLTIANVIVANNQASLFDVQATSSAGDANANVVFVSATNPFFPANLQDVSVQGNTVFSGTCDATATGVEYPGLVFLSGTTSLVSTQVSNNTFYNTTLVYAGAVNGAVVLVRSDTITRGVSLLNNVLTETSAGGAPQDGLYVAAATSLDTHVSGNNLRLGTGVQGRGVHVGGPGAVAHTRMVVTDNTVLGFNETIYLGGGDLSNISVSNNTVSTENIATPVGVAISGANITAITVSGNDITSTDQGVHVSGGGTSPILDVSITNNQLHGALQEAIWVDCTDATVRRINVSGNTVSDSCTFGVLVDSVANALDRLLYDVVVQGNILKDPSIIGIDVHGAVNGSHVDIRGVTIANNVIEAVSGSLTGVRVSSDGSGAIDALTCTGNVLRLGNTSVGFDLDGDAATSSNLVFQGNVVTGLANAVGDDAIRGLTGAGTPDRVIVIGNTSNALAGESWNDWFVAVAASNSPTNADVALWNFN